MLDFVFRCDGVTDLERSFHSSALLDRHFKKAFRNIERTIKSEEEMTEKLSLLFSIRNIIESTASSVTATSTRQIPANTAAVLSVGEVNYPIRVISSRGDSLVTETPMNHTGTSLRLPSGSKVNLAFFTQSSKGFSVESRVMGTAETADGPVLQLVHSGKIKKLSNRNFRRRQTVISMSYYFVNTEETGHGKKKQIKLTIDKRQFSGNILDISIGGCSIQTKTYTNLGQKLKIEFTREDRSVVVALGEVLRTGRAGMNTVLHVKFLKVPRKSLNSINAVVYEYTGT
jgi:c-di-GMP-binding flagellar brake protein YcgR